jgi:multiple sugar transport system substrate-binding protein
MDRIPSTPGVSRRSILVASGGVASAALLAACGGKSTPPGQAAPAGGNGGISYTGPRVTVAFWTGWTGADGDVAKQMIDKFNAETSNIHVNMSTYQWGDFLQKLPAAVQSGNGPDVGVMHLDDMPTQAAQQVIVPLDDVAHALNLQQSNYSPAVWNGGIFQGKRYAIPIDVHCLGMYYNQTAMENAGLDPNKPPTGNDDYMSMLETLKSKGIQGSWVSPFQFTGGFWFESLLWQFGGDLFDSGVTKATWDSDAGAQALGWMVDLVKKGYSPSNVGQDADYVALKNGKNVFNWQGIWQVNDATKLPNMKIAVAPLPKIGTQGGVWGNSHQFVLPRKRSNDANIANASRYFIDWFTKNELLWATSAKVPANNQLAASSQFKSMTTLVPFAEEVPDVHFPPSVPGIDDALGELYTAVNQAVLMKSSPQAALSSSASRANGILKDNAAKYGS